MRNGPSANNVVRERIVSEGASVFLDMTRCLIGGLRNGSGQNWEIFTSPHNCTEHIWESFPTRD